MVTVGFIGVGQMGELLAQFLLKDGFPVVVYDINPERIDALTRMGARPSTGASDLAAQSDVVITVLTYPEVVEKVIVGKGGVVEGIKKGTIVMETSSIDAETSIRVGNAVQSGGGRYVEVSLLGPPPVVKAKQLVFLAAGDKKSVRECEPLFQSMGRTSLYVGGLGKAKLLKIATAMVHAVEATAIYEVMAWLARNDISPEILLDARKQMTSLNLEGIREIVKGHFTRQPNWVAKDVYHGIKNAEERQIPMPLVSTVHGLVNWGKSQGLEEYPFSELIWKLYQQTLAGGRGL